MSDEKTELKGLLNKVLQTKIDANRRYIDEVLEKIQDQTHQYYLQRLGYEVREMELAEQNGNFQLVMHHKVMVDTYRSILEKSFPA
jgi:tRNA pseudouridine-54 N-methylase